MTTLTINIVEGTKYVSTEYRGTEYTIYQLCGDWFVSTRRKSLGHMNTGSGKYYKTLQDVANNCKAFGSIEDLMNAFYCIGFNSQTSLI